MLELTRVKDLKVGDRIYESGGGLRWDEWTVAEVIDYGHGTLTVKATGHEFSLKADALVLADRV